MTENDQIQPGFQQENQENIQTQQNKSSSSWLNKILSIIFFLLGIGLIGLGIFLIFQTSSDWQYPDYSIRDIIMDSGIWILGPYGILFILIGILSYRTQNINIYYHPSRLTKIFSGIFWFVGIALIRAGLRNFSLIPSESYSTTKIIQIGGSITLFGILFFILGLILYSTKKWINMGFSLFYYSILFLLTSGEVKDLGYIRIISIICFIYLIILTYVWVIKCLIFKKWGKVWREIGDKQPSSKKLGVITTIILFILVICNCIYGKIQYLKLPEVDESTFLHYEHNTKLPEEEDAIIQINKALQGTGEIRDIIDNLHGIYMNTYNDNSINWTKYPNECDIIYSGGNSYCGTRIRDNKTLNRLLNRYIDFNSSSYNQRDENKNYLTLNGKKVTILEYIDKNEPKLREFYKKIDNLTKLNYYLPDDQYLDVYNAYIQPFATCSDVMIRYYTYKQDREMIELIIKLNYKLADIAKSVGGNIYVLVAYSVHSIIDGTVNSSVNLFPKNLRRNLINWYQTQTRTTENISKDIAKGEYTLWKQSQKEGCIHLECRPGINQFLFHLPFNYPQDTKRLMLYSYSLIYNNTATDNTSYEIRDKFKKSLYNYDGLATFGALYPSITSINRINNNIYHKEGLITNLKNGEIKVWLYKPDREFNPREYNNYLLSDSKK